MVASFSIASNRIYLDKFALKHINTQWFNCLAYGRLAENRKTHLAEGQQVCVESRLKSCTYTTKEGQTRSSFDVTVSDVHFLSDKRARYSALR
jgi:single-strand DNA-binding protein